MRPWALLAVAALLFCASSAAPSFDAMIAINYANPVVSWSGSSDCSTSIHSSSFMGVNCTMVSIKGNSPCCHRVRHCTRVTSHLDRFRFRVSQQRYHAPQRHHERQAGASNQVNLPPLPPTRHESTYLHRISTRCSKAVLNSGVQPYVLVQLYFHVPGGFRAGAFEQFRVLQQRVPFRQLRPPSLYAPPACGLSRLPIIQSCACRRGFGINMNFNK
jgi:hypothetical protein